MQLKGKAALITGGVQGLGCSFAESLLREGCRVCMVDIQERVGQKKLQEFQKKYGEDSVMFVSCDVTNKAQLERTFKAVKDRFGRIDIAVNNAGIGGSEDENIDKMIDINVKGVMYGTFIAFRHMNRNKGGHGGVIINTGSTAGLTIVPYTSVYVGSKHAVVSFTRSVAGHFDLTEPDHGVRVNALCPSFTLTPILGDKEPPAHMKEFGIMKPERVAEAFMQLVQDDRTGAALAVTPYKMKYRHEGSKL